MFDLKSRTEEESLEKASREELRELRTKTLRLLLFNAVVGLALMVAAVSLKLNSLGLGLYLLALLLLFAPRVGVYPMSKSYGRVVGEVGVRDHFEGIFEDLVETRKVTLTLLSRSSTSPQVESYRVDFRGKRIGSVDKIIHESKPTTFRVGQSESTRAEYEYLADAVGNLRILGNRIEQLKLD